jgi:hypothetical protein
MVGFKDYLAPAAAVTAAWSAFGPILLALKGHAAFAAVPCPSINFYLIYEHRKRNWFSRI